MSPRICEAITGRRLHLVENLQLFTSITPVIAAAGRPFQTEKAREYVVHNQNRFI